MQQNKGNCNLQQLDPSQIRENNPCPSPPFRLALCSFHKPRAYDILTDIKSSFPTANIRTVLLAWKIWRMDSRQILYYYLYYRGERRGRREGLHQVLSTFHTSERERERERKKEIEHGIPGSIILWFIFLSSNFQIKLLYQNFIFK
jgi:hypothetical protein